MREISYLHLTRFVQFLLDRKDRMSMAVGLEVLVLSAFLRLRLRPWLLPRRCSISSQRPVSRAAKSACWLSREFVFMARSIVRRVPNGPPMVAPSESY